MTDTIQAPGEPNYAAVKIDESRTFGEIWGEDAHNGVFEQDGFKFDVKGNLIVHSLTDADRKRLDERLNREAALVAAKAAFRERMPGIAPEELDRIVSTAKLEEITDEAIDLKAWARGDKQYIWGKVQKAIKDRFNQSPTNKKQGLEILAAHGVHGTAGADPTTPY